MKIDFEKGKQGMKKGNNGFTLIELVLAMAIASVVLLMVTFLFELGGKRYQDVQEELKLQKESQMVTSQLEQLILNANRFKVIEADGKKELYLWRVERQTGKILEEEVIAFQKDELLLSKKENDRQLFSDRSMAKMVKDFFIALPTEDRPMVEVRITFALNKKEYQTVQKIALRNELVE